MPSPVACGVLYLLVSALMLIPAIVPWAAVPLEVDTLAPTASPTVLTASPTTMYPTSSPTSRPTFSPSRSPSHNPSSSPTASPSVAPSRAPSRAPSLTPTASPVASNGTVNGTVGRRLDYIRRTLQSSGKSGDIRLLWLIWLWPCVTYLLMGLAYIFNDPGDTTTHRPMGVALLGKELDGSMRWYCMLFMLPTILPLWIFWYIRHSTWLRHERPFDEVVPGVYLGRYPYMTLFSKWKISETYPEEASTIVDLAAEMPIPRAVYKGRRYFSIPTLDQCPPNVEALREIGTALGTSGETPSGNNSSTRQFRRLYTNEDTEGEGVRVRGSVYVICANGRGRSAAFVLTLLVIRGDCEAIEQAIQVLRKARPQINPRADQVRAAKDAVNQWRAYSSSKKARPRNLSNAEPIIDQFDIVGTTLETTESRNVIRLIAVSPKQSSGKLQVAEAFARKRTRDDMQVEPPHFVLLGSINDSGPILELVREDVYLMVSDAVKHTGALIGGDLFGKQSDAIENPAEQPFQVSHVTGAGPRAVVQQRLFRQDENYFREALRVVSPFGNRRIGEWHSHHGDAHPTVGDLENMSALLAGTQHKWFVLCIVGIVPGRPEVEVAAYLFSSSMSQGQEPAQMTITLLDASHDHEVLAERLEDLRLSESTPSQPVFLRDAEFRSQGQLPLPEPALEATESRNVIVLQ